MRTYENFKVRENIIEIGVTNLNDSFSSASSYSGKSNWE